LADGSIDILGTFIALHNEWKTQYSTLEGMQRLMPTEKFAKLQGALGKQGLAAIFNLDPRQVERAEKAFNSATGYAKAQEEAILKLPLTQLQRWNSTWALLHETIGRKLLPALVPFLLKLNDLISMVIDFVNHHSRLVAVVGESVIAFGGLFFIIGSILAPLGMIGRSIKGVADGLETLGVALKYIQSFSIVGTLGSIVSMLNRLAQAFQALGAAIAANPLILVIAAILAAFFLLGYEMAKHWDTVKRVWSTSINWIINLGKRFIGWLMSSDWGYALAFAIAGPFGLAALWIARHWETIKKVTTEALQWISDHLPHSPPKMGPLRDLRPGALGEWIGESLDITPAVRAMDVALHRMPRGFHGPELIPAYGMGTGRGGGMTIQIVSSPTINLGGMIGDKKDVELMIIDALRHRDRELVHLINVEVDRRLRTKEY
jgi:hypothetical protein